jgi:hypothetical protein
MARDLIRARVVAGELVGRMAVGSAMNAREIPLLRFAPRCRSRGSFVSLGHRSRVHLRRTHLDHVDRDLCWLLLYTKARAESWADINLRTQGYATLLPRVRQRTGFAPLFPRYVFAGVPCGADFRSARSTRGVLYVVRCGENPARVPLEVVEEIRARMNEQGVVELEATPFNDPLFARRERDRVRALVKFAQAGFRVVA